MSYRVLITDEATDDVFNLVKYIHVDLCNPDAANKLYTNLNREVNNMGDFPLKFADSGKMLGLPEDAVIIFYTAAGNNNKWSAGKQFTQRIAYSTDLLKWEQTDGVRHAAYINKMAYAAQTYSNTGNLCMTVQ